MLDAALLVPEDYLLVFLFVQVMEEPNKTGSHTRALIKLAIKIGKRQDR